jgi:uncharacterized repeat protein (TIGR01451 family)
LRISNAYNPAPDTRPPEYHYQTYSKPTIEAAGEGGSNKEYTAQFSFISIKPNQQQPGLIMDVSPDNGEGGRMSYIGLEDTEQGIDVIFYDTPGSDGDFVGYDLGTLTRNVPHTIRFWMKLNPGLDNDLVRIFIDGRDVGQCFTTWENFYRATSQSVPTSDRLLFRSKGAQVDQSLVGGGYLFDNVTTTTANGKGPPGCDLPIDKEAHARTVSAGGQMGYRLTVRNRGSATARDLRLCDRLPRRTTFISADRKLSRVGRQRCLAISRLRPGERVSVHLVLAVDADAPGGTLTNIADLTPLEALSRAIGSSGGGLLGSPGAPGVRRAVLAIRRARAVVRVLARRVQPPTLTG